MSAPKKPKSEELREARQNPPQPREDGHRATQNPVDYSKYTEPQTVTISARIEEADRAALTRYAEERGLKPGQVVRAWILERMRREGIR
jgi:hypothetical protein